VVSQEADSRFVDHKVEALARVWTVADDVAEAENLFDALTARVFQDGLERFQIAVNIANDGPFQFTARFGALADNRSGGRLGNR
jgi:hypothetical protein